MPPLSRASSLTLCALLAVVGAACGGKTPTERVREARARYTVQLSPFVVREVPAPTAATEMPAAPPEGTTAEAPPAEGEEPATAPTETEILLDVVLIHSNPKPLPGITLDVTMASADGTEKGHWLWWVDTSDLPQGTQRQVSYTLHDVDYEEGDGLSVSVRRNIPDQELADYREFQTAGG